MFCPTCGTEERSTDQFCRTCGTDIRAIRTNLERPGVVRGSAVSAREEIAFSIAEHARSLKDVSEMQVFVEEILPAIEKFLDGPDDRRLRRIRNGVVTSAAGLGFAVFMLLMTMMEAEVIPGVGVGLGLFLIGVGIIVNGYFFTISRPAETTHEQSAELRDLLSSTVAAANSQRFLTPPGSVVESTTRHLEREQGKAASPRATGE